MILSYGVIQSNVIGLFVLFSSAINYHGAVPNYENQFVQSVVVVEGRIANLPCDVKPSFRGDKIHIVIWYRKGDNGKLTPIYTFDSRDNLYLDQGKHWSDELVLGGRAYFRFQDEPAKLVINNILPNDAGVYQCRVDFKQSPTRLSEVNLTVIVPPTELTVLNEKGFQVADYYLGPYKEGSSINVTCVCTGGFPTPKLTWWLENALLDDSYENLSGNIVRNVLHIERLQRKHLDAVLTCQASNNDVAAPIAISRSLDINLRPLSVKILGQNKPFSEGKTYQLQCEVVGARPAPIISWWKGGTKLSGAPVATSTNGNILISIMQFTPSLNDEGKYISCIVEQPQISTDIIERRWKLNIHHVPLVSLELSNKLSNGIEEGSDVYFECNIKSNPWVYKLSWTYNGKMLYSNRTEGIILSNQSLVLQDVSRNRSGTYTCIGINQEGEGESNPINLEITFAPVCRTGHIAVSHEVSLHETVKINCVVEANPAAAEFAWEFYNPQAPPYMIPFYETASTISYTPITENDYGTLHCSASNIVGNQKEPCIFQIIYIDKPHPLSNCSLLNQTHQSLLVKCAYHLSDDSNQAFIAEVYDTQSHKLLKNLSSDSPTFLITGLIQTLEVQIDLYVTNGKAKSTTTRLTAIIPKLEEPLADVLLPPENCSVTSHTHYHLRIKCQVSKIPRRKSLTYLLQVYDANSHTLVGTSTSQPPEAITVTALPRDCRDLLPFIRASVPVRLHITPRLSITICVVLIIIVTIIVILGACRLCGKRKHNSRNSKNGRSSVHADPEYEYPSTRNIENINPDIIPLRNAVDQEEQQYINEFLHKGSSETYVKLADPEELIAKPVQNTKFTSIQSQPRLMFTNWQPPTLGLPLQYESVNESYPEDFRILPHFRLPNANVYRTGVHADLSAPLQEWASVNSQDNRNVLQPHLGNLNTASGSPQQQIKVTQI